MNDTENAEKSSDPSAGKTQGLKEYLASLGIEKNIQKLNTIIVPEFGCHEESLIDIVKRLYNLAEELDPTGDGVNLLIDGFSDPSFEWTPVDLDSGRPPPIQAPFPDFAYTKITIEPRLKSMALGTVVQTVARASSIPLKTRIEEYAVVFSRDIEEEQLRNRKARVDAERFDLIPGSLLPSEDAANQELLTKLHQIILDEVNFKNRPLRDVIKFFIGESKNKDPDQGGIGFIINNQLMSPSDGLAVGDLAESRVEIDPPLQKVRLSEALETVARVSEIPLLITLNDNTVLLSQRVTPLLEVSGESEGQSDVDHSETLGSDPVVQIDIQMLELDDHALETLGLDWFLKAVDTANAKLSESEGRTGGLEQTGDDEHGLQGFENVTTQYESVQSAPNEVLTPDQMQRLMSRARKQNGISVIVSSTITTPNGRPAVVSSLSQQIVLVDIDPAGRPTSANLQFGSSIDVTPRLEDDNTAIHLELAAVIREFLGYDDPRPLKTTSADGTVLSPKPLPRIQVRQVTTEARLPIGNTLFVAGPDRADLVVTKDKVPVLGDIPMIGRLFRNSTKSTDVKKWILFVTANLVEQSEPDRLERDVERDESATGSDGAAPPGRRP